MVSKKKYKQPDRLKILVVPHRVVLELLTNVTDRMKFKDDVIPDESCIIAVYQSYETSSFNFVIEHESYAPVPPGAIPPKISIEWERYINV